MLKEEILASDRKEAMNKQERVACPWRRRGNHLGITSHPNQEAASGKLSLFQSPMSKNSFLCATFRDPTGQLSSDGIRGVRLVGAGNRTVQNFSLVELKKHNGV